MGIVGSGKLRSRTTSRLSSSTRPRPSAAVWRVRMVFTSPPEQKWPPAPVRITTRAVGSASISSSTPSISRRMARSSALRASGRFSVIVAIPSARSTSRVWSPTFHSFRWSPLSPATIADARPTDKSASRVVEALHLPSAVGPGHVLEAAARVAADDPPPERLRLDVAPELGDLPPAREHVEDASGHALARAPPPVPAQDQELADLARPVPRELRAVADQREARELPVHADQERPPVGVGPEAFAPRLDPVEPVVAEAPAVDRAEVVEIELHQAPEDRWVLATRFPDLDVHDAMLRYPVMRLARTLIGMVHLQPLPGSPRWEGSMARVIEAALADARALVEGGIDALLVENFGDAPFTAGRVDAATVAGVTAVAAEIPPTFAETPLGVNVLQNDARAAPAVVAAVRGPVIRVNVHAGAVVADQGIVETDAYHTLRDRRPLRAEARILAGVRGKHAVP